MTSGSRSRRQAAIGVGELLPHHRSHANEIPTFQLLLERGPRGNDPVFAFIGEHGLLIVAGLSSLEDSQPRDIGGHLGVRCVYLGPQADRLLDHVCRRVGSECVLGKPQGLDGADGGRVDSQRDRARRLFGVDVSHRSKPRGGEVGE